MKTSVLYGSNQSLNSISSRASVFLRRLLLSEFFKAEEEKEVEESIPPKLVEKEVRDPTKSVRFAGQSKVQEDVKPVPSRNNLRRHLSTLSINKPSLQSIEEEVKVFSTNLNASLKEGKNEVALPVAFDPKFFYHIDMPKNVVKRGQKLKQPVFPENFEIDSLVLIKITEVLSPFKFWFQIKNEYEYDALDSLMDDLK